MKRVLLVVVGVVGVMSSPVWAAPQQFRDWITSLTTGTADGTMYVLEGTTSRKMAQDDANTPSTLVRRDASGNFAAGTITASLTGTASGNIADGGTPTDNAIVRWDGTSGTSVQNSDVTIADLAAGSVTVGTTPGTELSINVTEPAATTGPSVAGDPMFLTAGDAVASTDTAGAAAGGDVTIAGGVAARLTSGNANGGDIILDGGAGIGTGTAGQVLLNDAGTSAAPAIAFAASTGTGIYDGAGGNMRFASAGSQKMLISTSSITAVAPLNGNSAGSEISGFAFNTTVVTTTATTSGSTAMDMYTNTGDTDGATITLMDNPTQGICYMFGVDAAQTLTVVPSTGETLYEDGDQCAVSLTSSTVGSAIKICAMTGGSGAKWVTIGGASVWACNDT
jgi:hypothetical protein